jgi:universal stress protein A
MKVLICADFSTAGKHVLTEAQKFLAEMPGAEIHIFNVIDTGLIAVGSMYNNGDMITILESEAEKIKGWADEIFKGREINFACELGQPADATLKQATNLGAGLLIIGTHGRTGMGRVVIGSVAERVLRHCHCNVLVIPVKDVNHEWHSLQREERTVK